jgi:hypothetical protein
MQHLIAVIVILSSAVGLAAEPLQVGSRHELFIDDHLVSRMEGLKCTLHQPKQSRLIRRAFCRHRRECPPHNQNRGDSANVMLLE